MKITRKCHGCGQEIRKDEMIQYSTLSGKTSYWFCRSCYEDKLARERFQMKVCQIFGIKSPGPLIWTQRKRLQDTYGYTDDAIVDCLEYIYHVKNMNKLKESLGLINPRNMEEMKRWRATKKTQASNVVAAIVNTEIIEETVPFNIEKNVKKEINLDDALLQ